jgi:phosphomannomutase
MSVFKAYDIRGTYPDQVDEGLARRIGSAFTRLLGARSLVVGRDMRTMAPSIADAFIEGACRQGADIVRIGLASTPMTYYAIGALGVDGGVQVTASHNPGNYIGFKFCREGCIPISGDTGIKDLERMVSEPEPPPAMTEGRVKDKEIMAGYIDHVAGFATGMRPVKLVVDVANAMGGLALPHLLRRLGIEARVLFPELDGSFPNHEANPLKEETLRWLSEAVREDGADLGVAYDGDADRVVFVDSTGHPARSDFITAALAQDFLARSPGSAVVYDLRSSRSTRDAILEAGGIPIRERVGHSFIKATMRKEGAILGGELSGHYYFRDNYVSDSGDIALVCVLSLLARKNVDVAALVAPFRRYASTGEVNFRVDDPDRVMADLASRFDDGEKDDLDGITIQYPDWWFNVRKSNTEPLVRLNLEADTDELLVRRRAEVESILGTPIAE